MQSQWEKARFITQNMENIQYGAAQITTQSLYWKRLILQFIMVMLHGYASKLYLTFVIFMSHLHTVLDLNLSHML